MKKILLYVMVLSLFLAGCTSKNEEVSAAPKDEKAEITNGEYPSFDFDSKTVTLNSGYAKPILGLGTFSLSDVQAENSTYWAFKAGFRLIDTARIYGNEEAVGRGLQRAIDEGIVNTWLKNLGY